MEWCKLVWFNQVQRSAAKRQSNSNNNNNADTNGDNLRQQKEKKRSEKNPKKKKKEKNENENEIWQRHNNYNPFLTLTYTPYVYISLII